jgi:hypothetical protein
LPAVLERVRARIRRRRALVARQVRREGLEREAGGVDRLALGEPGEGEDGADLVAQHRLLALGLAALELRQQQPFALVEAPQVAQRAGELDAGAGVR